MLHNFRRKAIAKVSKEKRLARVQGETIADAIRKIREEKEIDRTREKQIQNIESVERLPSENP